MKCDTIQKSCKRTSRFLEHSLIIFTVLIIMSGGANASVMHVPLWRQVEMADVIVSGTITAMRDEGTDKSVGTIAVLEVIRGDATLKTVEVRPGPLSRDNMGVSKSQAGVWLLKKAKDKPPTATSAYYNPDFDFQPKIMTPLVKMLVAAKKDDSVLALYTGWFEDLDREVIEYAASLKLTGTTAVRTASHALSSPYWSCRGHASGWLRDVVTTPEDARTALPALMVTANRIEDINKGGNSGARGAVYEAIRQILLRLGVTTAEKLPVVAQLWRGLEDSAEETKRSEAEAAIRHASELAQDFMRSQKTKTE